jgi:hypothetical protein
MSKILVLPPAELDCSHHIISIIELVIRDAEHFEVLVDSCSS